MKNLKYSFLLLLFIGFVACEPEQDDKSELGALPNPSFNIEAGETPNNFKLINTTPDVFLTNWDLGDFGSFSNPAQDETEKEVDINIPIKGDYEITMTTFNRGGSASSTQTVNVSQDQGLAPVVCTGNVEILTGNCNEKVWKLAPEVDALHVGPAIDEYWWGNDEGTISSRACLWNDEFIFKSTGEFEYDDKGDFFADELNGVVIPSDLGVAPGCHPYTDLAQQYQVWGPGIHQFNATETTITLTGQGAWMGLYKAGSTEEVTSPQSSVTYNIVSITDTRLVVYTTYPAGDDTGHWRFTFVSE